MIPKHVAEHIFYLRYGYTKEVAKILKEESEKFKKRKYGKFKREAYKTETNGK